MTFEISTPPSKKLSPSIKNLLLFRLPPPFENSIASPTILQLCPCAQAGKPHVNVCNDVKNDEIQSNDGSIDKFYVFKRSVTLASPLSKAVLVSRYRAIPSSCTKKLTGQNCLERIRRKKQNLSVFTFFMSWTKDALVVLLTLLTWTVFVAKVCWTANIFIVVCMCFK